MTSAVCCSTVADTNCVICLLATSWQALVGRLAKNTSLLYIVASLFCFKVISDDVMN